MSESEESPHHSGVRGIVERITEHHHQAVERREEEALAEAADNAAFDLATDIALPAPGHDPVGYDVETDLGFDEEPPELRP